MIGRAGIWVGVQRALVGVLLVAGALLVSAPAKSVEIELTDVAPDRVERQRAFTRGDGVLPGTPDVGRLGERLTAKGLALGDAVFVRVFKMESQLEVWMRKGDRFVLLDTYPICHWTGTIGPKLREGDKQSPEGFYSIAAPQLRHLGRWRRGLNIGFPNAYDQLHQRTGSYILIHGGCSSTGCFAMTGPVQDEIYRLAEAAIRAGQPRIHIHIFPFRMTDANLAAHRDSIWRTFWEDLKVAHDAFERTRVPPHVEVCEHRYAVSDGVPGDTGSARPVGIARASRIATADSRLPASAACQLQSDAGPPRLAGLQVPDPLHAAPVMPAVISDARDAPQGMSRLLNGSIEPPAIRPLPRRLPHAAVRRSRVEPPVATRKRRLVTRGARRASRAARSSVDRHWATREAATLEKSRRFLP